MTTMAIVSEAGLWLYCRKEQRRRQQGKLSRARDKSEHKNMEKVCVCVYVCVFTEKYDL